MGTCVLQLKRKVWLKARTTVDNFMNYRVITQKRTSCERNMISVGLYRYVCIQCIVLSWYGKGCVGCSDVGLLHRRRLMNTLTTAVHYTRRLSRVVLWHVTDYNVVYMGGNWSAGAPARASQCCEPVHCPPTDTAASAAAHPVFWLMKWPIFSASADAGGIMLSGWRGVTVCLWLYPSICLDVLKLQRSW